MQERGHLDITCLQLNPNLNIWLLITARDLVLARYFSLDFALIRDHGHAYIDPDQDDLDHTLVDQDQD